MRTIGIVLLACGAIAFMIGFNIDTTVATELGTRRVHNIGLMNEKQNFILLAGALAVVGAVLVGFGSRGRGQGAASSTEVATGGTRSCPFCAETIKSEAVICRFCSREVTSSAALVARDDSRNESEPSPEVMALYDITFDGERYHYGGYRYEKYRDVVAYAKLQSSKR